VNFTGGEGMDPLEYSQSCKGKNTVILGFVWTCNSEIVFITDHGVELFQVSYPPETSKDKKKERWGRLGRPCDVNRQQKVAYFYL
jgi:hypothetical protein